MMEDDKVDILFLGLVRKPQIFKKSVKEFIEFKNKGLVNQILFSTWKGEVQKYPEIWIFLKKHGVKIIESNEPKDRGLGNIWCQMKSLDIGLSKINTNRFVLKTRSDVYIPKDFLRNLFKEKRKLLKIEKNLPKGNIFKHKVWIPYFELKTPFHIGEECFFGHHHDLKLLVNYDRAYDNKYKIGDAVSHIRRFVNPFLKDYPIFYDYLSRYSKDNPLKTLAIKFSKRFFEIRHIKILRKVGEKNKFKRFKEKLKNQRFVDCLAAYYSILYSHFYIDNYEPKKRVIFSEYSKPTVKLDLKKMEINFSKAKVNFPTSGQVYGYDAELLNNIANKNLDKTPVGIKIMKAVDKFNSQ